MLKTAFQIVEALEPGAHPMLELLSAPTTDQIGVVYPSGTIDLPFGLEQRFQILHRPCT